MILAGGLARRFGGEDKAFINLAGRPLIEHVIKRLAPQVDELLISSNAPAEKFAAYALPVIPDVIPGHIGPLAGIHTGTLSRPGDYLAIVAVDLPFLPSNLVDTLRRAALGARCAYASDGHRHALALVCAPGCAGKIDAFLQQGGRSIKEWLALQGQAVVLPAAPGSDIMLNINTPDELLQAHKFLEKSGA